MAIRRGSRLDKHLLYFRRISVALAGLVRARHQFANRRVQPEPQGAGEILMPTKSEQHNLVWRYIWTIALIVATVGAASVAARWTGQLG